MTRPAAATPRERGHAAPHPGAAPRPEHGMEYGLCDGSHRRGAPVPDAGRDRCVYAGMFGRGTRPHVWGGGCGPGAECAGRRAWGAPADFLR